MVKNNIDLAPESHDAAEGRGKEGQADLVAVVLSCTKTSLIDLIESTWEMIEKTSRIQVLEKASMSSCVDGVTWNDTYACVNSC